MKQSVSTQHLKLKSYAFRLYETTIIRLHVSEICKEGNHIAVAMHSIAGVPRMIFLFLSIHWKCDATHG